MNGFLTFLSNNYLYFLIAAGVLFFALLGFLVDLKKKKDDVNSNEAINEVPIPDFTSINDNQTFNEENKTETESNDGFNVPNESNVSFNPAPPMPEEVVNVYDSEPVETQTEVLNNISTEILEPTTPNIPQEEMPQVDQVTNQTESTEEFK